MRKLLCIPLVVLILFSGLTVNIASHYCCGELVATRVSLSGVLANCGMVSDNPVNTSQVLIKKHCCDNSISAYSFNNLFVPSFSFLSYSDLPIVDVADIQYENSSLTNNSKIVSEELIKPPGRFSQLRAEQEVLCIFRI